jgi:Domain of unknown function (DUF4407)
VTIEDVFFATVLAVIFAGLFGAIFDLAPLIAKAMVRQAARWWESDLDSSEQLSEEWQALIDERPVGLLKVGTGLALLVSATLHRSRCRIRQLSIGGVRWGRPLRAIAGVDEKLLDLVPHERARYTSLGGIVLTSSIIGGGSTWFAVEEIARLGRVWTMILAVIACLFMLNLNRWLISSLYGAGISRRPTALLPRLIISILMGVILAEPLIIGTFRSPIDQNISASRVAFESTLIMCNPVSHADAGAEREATQPACSGFRLNLPSKSDRGYLAMRTAAVNRLVAEKRSSQGSDYLTGPVGLIRRFQSLNEITAHSASFEFATWILRLFLLVLYCLPILIMMISGTSGYERVIASRQNAIT